MSLPTVGELVDRKNNNTAVSDKAVSEQRQSVDCQYSDKAVSEQILRLWTVNTMTQLSVNKD